MNSRAVGIVAALMLAVPGTVQAQQGVELAPGASVTVRALADTVFVVDTLIRWDTVTVTQIDTVFVVDTVYACPDGWTCTEGDGPAAPVMYVAGWMTPMPPAPAEHNGLHVHWESMPADSFRVTGSKADGSDPFEAVVPGSQSSYRQELFYDTVTAMRGCVSAIRFGIEGTEACDDMEWAPMVQRPQNPPGRPAFTALTDGRVRVTWDEVPAATEYRYWYTGHSESEGLVTNTNSVILSDFAAGGFFCARGANWMGVALNPHYRCNSFRP